MAAAAARAPAPLLVLMLVLPLQVLLQQLLQLLLLLLVLVLHPVLLVLVLLLLVLLVRLLVLALALLLPVVAVGLGLRLRPCPLRVACKSVRLRALTGLLAHPLPYPRPLLRSPTPPFPLFSATAPALQLSGRPLARPSRWMWRPSTLFMRSSSKLRTRRGFQWTSST